MKQFTTNQNPQKLKILKKYIYPFHFGLIVNVIKKRKNFALRFIWQSGLWKNNGYWYFTNYFEKIF